MIKDLGFFLNCLQKHSEEKIDNGVYATFQTNLGKTFLIIFLLWVLVLNFLSKLFGIAFIISVGYYFWFLCDNIGALGITENKIIIVRVNYFTHKVKEAYEVRKDALKNVEIKKGWLISKVKISFVDEVGRFRQLKIVYGRWLVGKGFRNQKENAKVIYEVLRNEQKIIEKGDF